MFSLFSFAYYTFRGSLHTERQLRITETQRLNTENDNLQLRADNLQLKSENLELQNQKLIAEYNYLKSQINPHFLYNTLNFFYAETLQHAPKAAEGIALLSHIMRYSLNPAETDGKVPLADEVLHLSNYLGLQRLRFGNGLKLDCNLPGNIPSGYRILPHMLLTLAENAFKHGETDSAISVNLSISNGNIIYTVSNSTRVSRMINKMGVGLVNMQNRLELFYGNNARLDFDRGGSLFIATLEIRHAVPETSLNSVPEITN